MDNFQIENAQNVQISQNVSGIWERILAYLVDALILLSYSIIMILVMSGLGLSNGEEWVLFLVLGLPLFLYFLLFEVLWNGRTPGKAALLLRVVKLDGSKPTFSSYLIRWLLRIVDITLTSGSVAVITILMNGKGQRLGDLAANTTVISEKPQAWLHQTLIMDIPEDYSPKYPQVTVLSDKDIQDIKDLYRDALKNHNHKIVRSLSLKVSALMEVTPEQNPVDFVATVIRDYNYFAQR